jgi:hypothetical protein
VRPKASPHTVLAEIMPARLAQDLTAAHLPAGEMANISNRTLTAFASRLKCWHLRPDRTEGYAKADRWRHRTIMLGRAIYGEWEALN